MRKSFQINGMINNVEDHHLYFITYDIDESIKQQVNSFCISNNIKIIIIIIRKDLLRLLFYFRMLHKRESEFLALSPSGTSFRCNSICKPTIYSLRIVNLIVVLRQSLVYCLVYCFFTVLLQNTHKPTII